MEDEEIRRIRLRSRAYRIFLGNLPLGPQQYGKDSLRIRDKYGQSESFLYLKVSYIGKRQKRIPILILSSYQCQF